VIGLTSSGLLFVPFTLILLFLRPNWLFPVAIVAAIFPAMSVLNLRIGTFELGISPYYFTAILLTLSLLAQLLTKRPLYLSPATRVFLFFLGCFALIAVTSALTLPRFFADLPVYSPRLGIDGQVGNLTPLSWSFSNLGQALYLSLNIGVVLSIFTKKSISPDSSIFLWLGLGLFFIFFALQIGTRFFGLPYPADILYSNPIYYQGYEQVLPGLGLPRLNATFSEPSNAGSYLGAMLAFILTLAFQTRRKRYWLASLCVMIALLLTTSSSGYLVLGVVGAVALGLPLLKFLLKQSLSKKLLGTWASIVFACLVAVIPVTIAVFPILDEVILSKPQSNSFINRISSDLDALTILVQTYGLGAGLGSNRPSSFLTYLLSNIGWLATGCFFVALWVLFYTTWTKQNAPAQAVVAALSAYLVAKLIAAPDLADSLLWVLMAVVIAQLQNVPETRTEVTDYARPAAV
jgi:hypothetical protein